MENAQQESADGEVYSKPKKLGFARQLASCNKKTRDRAVEIVRLWLISQKQVGEEDLKKIWKGLFYCVWHADKQPVQAQLIDKLASLVRTLDLKLSRQYFQVFLLTMRREWSGIDHLRLDKFYLLLRRLLYSVFLVLETTGWDSQQTKGFMDDLTDRAFLAADRYPAQGTNLHFVDIYLDELRDFLPLRRETFGLVFDPLYTVLMKSSDKLLLKRVKCNVFDCLLENGRKLIECRHQERHDADVDVDIDDNVEKFGCIALTMGITERLFESATSSSALQANRKVIFALHEEFGKLDKHFSASGVSVFPQRAKRPKLSADKSLEVADLTSKELTVGEQAQQVDPNIDTIEESIPDVGKKMKGKKGKSAKAKKVANIIDGNSTKKKTKSSGSSKLLKNKSNLKGQKDAVDEAGIDHMYCNYDGAYEAQNLADGDRTLGDSMELGDSVISNLQKQFEKVAAEVGDDLDHFSSPVTSLTGPVCNSNAGSKKRKKIKSVDNKVTRRAGSSRGQEKGGTAAGSVHFSGVNSAAKTSEKSAKKVRFSMKSNLIWKPHSPLPPQSVRVPPSATPRGSALKKGVPPGPIRALKESPSPKRLRQRSMALRKSPKILKTISPSAKLHQIRRSNIW